MLATEVVRDAKAHSGGTYLAQFHDTFGYIFADVGHIPVWPLRETDKANAVCNPYLTVGLINQAVCRFSLIRNGERFLYLWRWRGNWYAGEGVRT